MMAKRGLVAHVTTVHPRDDIRIFHKECVSLARAGYEVVQIVGDGGGDSVVDGVRIVDIGQPPAGRLARMRHQPRRVGDVLRRLQPALLHFHDPELLPLGSAIARGGVPVIYDAHEDVPRQVLTKRWIPALLRPAVSWAFERYENAQVRRLTAVVAATPHIARRFERVARRSVNVSNFPFLDELTTIAGTRARERAVCYVGSITRSRGAFEMVRAMAALPGIRLLLAGRFEDAALETALRAESGWSQVEYLGLVGRAQVAEIMARARVGLVTLQPLPSYQESLPIKMFEYMSASLPVVASHFPLWTQIIEDDACGLCVDPSDPAAIASAVQSLIDEPAKAGELGRRGRDAVISKYNWPLAERELLSLYQTLLRGSA
jgi:glycosyltransferase involved in cell wall biosynthesis